MKEIILTRGYKCYVDDDAYNVVNSYNWQAHTCNKSGVLASRGFSKLGHSHKVFMHKLLAGVPAIFRVAHLNGNLLDNQYENLQILDYSGNKYKHRKFSTKSEFKGVKWDAFEGLWQTILKGLHVGFYSNEIDAARAYNLKYVEIFGNAEHRGRLNVLSILRKYNEKKRNITGRLCILS